MGDTTLVLLSNASHKDFPGNTNSSFKVRLPRELRIEPNAYKVGLIDAHYSKNWSNQGGQTITVVKYEARRQLPIVQTDRVTITLPRGRYYTIAEMVNAFNKQIEKTKIKNQKINENVYFNYNEQTNRLQLWVKSVSSVEELMETMWFLRIPGGTSRLLGIPAGRYSKRHDQDPILLVGYPDKRVLQDLYSSLYVYCDLVEEYPVGDTLSPLLRILPRREDKVTEVYEEPRNIQWLSAAARASDTVEVNIRRDDGRLISFTGGKVILTVQLKPI